MLHRLRLALKTESFALKIGGKDSGGVEVDETFVSGKFKNMHKARCQHLSNLGRHAGGESKAIVQGMLDRDERKVRAKVVPNWKRETLQTEVLNNVRYGFKIYSDDAVV